MENFFRGVGYLFSWRQPLRYSRQTDADAIAADWEAVGSDMWAALEDEAMRDGIDLSQLARRQPTPGEVAYGLELEVEHGARHEN